MTRKVKELKQRAEKAWQRRLLYDTLLRDVYDYVLPMRDVSGLQTPRTGRAEADRRVDRVFDATAPRAAYRFAGRMQTDVVPLFQDFFSVEAGPLVPDSDDKKRLTEELQRVGSVAHGVLASGEFGTAAHEMFVDLYAGTGHMQILEGDDTTPVRCRVVPVPEVAIEEGPFGHVEHWYWRRKWRADELPRLWPKGRFGDKLSSQIKHEADLPIEICQYTYFDPAAKDYRLQVWSASCGDDEQSFWDERFRTSPWITVRFFKVPGEPYGRGPAMLAMPFVKTANKARELALKAAALAVMGVWMRRNDGVFNPDTVTMEPLSMWTVASTGGPLGPTVQRLPVPQDFDVSSIVMSEEREHMKLALFDETLPSESAAVRSATEIAERIGRLQQDFAGVAGRITLELVVPVVRRVIDVLEGMGLLRTSLKIDQLLTQVRVVAPIAASQHAAKVQAAVNWVQMLAMLGGDGLAAGSAKIEDLGPQLGRWLGIPEKFIRSDEERKRLAQTAAQVMVAQQQADAAKAAPETPPSQTYVNGGAL